MNEISSTSPQTQKIKKRNFFSVFLFMEIELLGKRKKSWRHEIEWKYDENWLWGICSQRRQRQRRPRQSNHSNYHFIHKSFGTTNQWACLKMVPWRIHIWPCCGFIQNVFHHDSWVSRVRVLEISQKCAFVYPFYLSSVIVVFYSLRLLRIASKLMEPICSSIRNFRTPTNEQTHQPGPKKSIAFGEASEERQFRLWFQSLEPLTAQG